VGIFPHGSADCGAEELAGNVWEWCSTTFIAYPFKDDIIAETLYTRNKRASRTYVLRGGAWHGSRAYARCAFRVGGSFARDDYGFRLARLFSSPSS
jgi:formylglycine-generating enzyme required for sulfatase activity